MALYRIQPSNESVLAMEVFKSGLRMGKKHVIFFEQYSGEVEYNREKPEESFLRFTVQTQSATCRDDWLKPAERKKVLATVNSMLAAEQHPEIGFTSNRVVARGPSRFEVQGTLTIRGAGKAADVDMTITPIGEDRLEMDGNSRISIRSYGMKPPSSALGLVRTKDGMLMRFLLWAERQS